MVSALNKMIFEHIENVFAHAEMLFAHIEMVFAHDEKVFAGYKMVFAGEVRSLYLINYVSILLKLTIFGMINSALLIIY